MTTRKITKGIPRKTKKLEDSKVKKKNYPRIELYYM